MESVFTVQPRSFAPHNYVLHRIRSHRPWSFPRHRHNGVFEFYYLFEGELTQHFDGYDCKMRTGDFLSIGEKEYHKVSGRKFDFFNLIIPMTYWNNLLDVMKLKEIFSPLDSEHRISTHFLSDKQSGILEDLEQLFQYQRTDYGDILLSRFLLGLAALLAGPPEIGGEAERISTFPDWMKTLMLEVDGRITEGLSVADLAELSAKTPEHLSRTFRQHLNITPSSWLNQQKLERAALMLEHSNTAIMDIALSLGFDNLGYFYRLFKGYYGLAPAGYRKQKSLVPYGD